LGRPGWRVIGSPGAPGDFPETRMPEVVETRQSHWLLPISSEHHQQQLVVYSVAIFNDDAGEHEGAVAFFGCSIKREVQIKQTATLQPPYAA